MTPGQQQRKDLQDESRRQQQADEHVRKLEQEVERLREALKTVRRGLSHIARRTESTPTRQDAIQSLSEIDLALDGGGDEQDE